MSFRIIFDVTKKNEYLFAAFNNNKDFIYQKHISKAIGIHEKTFSKIINGQESVSIKTAKKMMKLISIQNIDVFFKKIN